MSRAISRDPDRLVLFTDAVVAIAVTLLVLPLVDVVPETVHAHGASSEVFTDHKAQIYSFLLSFAVIIRLWLVHHGAFEHVRGYTRPLILWNAGWVLAIVLLPFTTEMVASYSSHDRFTIAVYIGNVLAAAVCQTVITVISYRDSDVASEDDPPTIGAVRGGLSTVLLLLVALVLAVLFPDVSYYGFLLLFLEPVVTRGWRLIGV
ncbi:TMEM175 family protein [Actinomadura sp. NTSP31]|uniref:TMEM175 family protein n=1 Tax=Actinomadura sp. NTSP31 TaxID=1735447 RepID=UPI0035C100D3